MEHLSRDEIRRLTAASDGRGASEVLATVAIVALAFAAVARWPTVPTVLLAVALLGGRQLALAVLLHECAHRSLFQSRRLNRWVGHLAAAAIWNRLDDYRVHHLGHHTRTGQPDDPDLGLVAPFPCSRVALARKLARDLLGITALRRIVGQLAMDLGRIRYTASVNIEKVVPTPPPRRQLAGLVTHLGPVLLFQAALVAVLAAFGHAELYGLWVLAWCTTFSFFLRIRAIAEHACTARTADYFQNTRTTLAGPLARLFVAPHGVNFHIEHHLLMTVPCYRLRDVHARLAERGAFGPGSVARGYGEVMRIVTSAPAPAVA